MQGELRILNQYMVRLFFSTPKLSIGGERMAAPLAPGPNHVNQAATGVIGDWICSKVPRECQLI